jgi:imidazolonepropionase-like amidohydrolase
MSAVERAARVRTIKLSNDSSLELRGATVLDGSGRAVKNATVRIRGERIEAISPGASPSSEPGAEVIDVSGLWIIPGLIDAHLHLATGARVKKDPAAAEQRADGLALLKTGLSYSDMLEGGVTTIRSLGGEPYENATALRRSMLDGFLVGPRILTAGTAVVVAGGTGEDRLVTAIKIARRNFGYLADVVMLGSCQVRTRAAFARREFDDLVDEAHRRRIRIAVRPITEAEAIAAAKAGVDSIDGVPADAGRRFVTTLHDTGTPLTPLLAARKDARKTELVAQAAEAGVKIVAGSDWSPAKPGQTLAAELGALRAAGMSSDDVLQAGTSRAADAIGLSDDLGTLAAGKLAELVVLRADPMKDPGAIGDPARIALVVQAGDPLTS